MIRVFPRKTNATPTDDLCFFDEPPFWEVPAKTVHVSCTFTFDKNRAEYLAKSWALRGYDVSIGGPAYSNPGDEFVPGRYLREGLVITSRGCNNDCWFCDVPNREGKLRELKIKQGFDILDNNLLQCSRNHVENVFAMVNQYKRIVNGKRKGPKFTGGFEALALKDWHVDLIAGLKPKPEILYFAYDTPNDYEPLRQAAIKMKQIGFNNQRVGCYVLMGYPKDTIEKAKKRLLEVVDLNIMPFAMLYIDDNAHVSPDWKDLQQAHIRAARTRSVYKDKFGKGL